MDDLILTKEYIESLGYEVEEVHDRIFLIKNFLTKDEVNEIVDQAKSVDEEEWKEHYMKGVIQLAKLKYGRTDIDNLVAEGLYEITHNWQDKNLEMANWDLAQSINQRSQEIFNFRDGLHFNGCGTIQRQYEGVPLKDHVDNHTDPSLEYAAVFYLNDDYTDGEVYFVNQEIELRPDPGSLLVFPTSEGWRHGVNAPGPGPHRYIIPGFISRNEFWKKHEELGYDVDKTLAETEYK
jgi:hypothetical protein